MAMSGTRKTILILVGTLAAVLGVLLICAAILVAVFRKGEPSIRNNSVLALRVGGVLPDYVPDDPFRRIFGGPDQSLTELLQQFKKAKVDKRISAILLEIDMSGVGWAKSDEIRDAIADFRKSGKPVYAYLEFGLNKEYYIASACDKIYLAPPGELFITGLAADVMFFRGALDKLGVYPDVYQIGKYKSAADMFTRKEMSDAHREATNAMLDDIYNRYVEAIAKGRSKSADEARAIIDNAPYGARKAKEAGIIDGASYRDEVEKELKAKLGFSVYHLLEPGRQFTAKGSDLLQRKMVAHGDLLFNFSTKTALAPSFIYQVQGHSTELIAGAMFRYYLHNSTKYTGYVARTVLALGGFYRNGDAAIVNMLLEWDERYAIGISYDLNLSSLNTVSGMRGGLEFSLRFSPPGGFLYEK